MKKFASLITITLLVIITYFAITQTGAAATICLPTAASAMPTSTNVEVFTANGKTTTTTLGLQNMLACPNNQAQIQGFSVRVSGNQNTLNHLLQTFFASNVYFQQIGAITIAYGTVTTFGATGTNLQIALRGNQITIGVPLILGSF